MLLQVQLTLLQKNFEEWVLAPLTPLNLPLHGHTITSSPLLLTCCHLYLLIQNLHFLHWTFYVTGCNVWEHYLKVSKIHIIMFAFIQAICLGWNHTIHEGTL